MRPNHRRSGGAKGTGRVFVILLRVKQCCACCGLLGATHSLEAILTSKRFVKWAFAALVAVFFALAAATALLDAMTTPGATPNGMQTYLLDATGGALLAFIAAQLGITVAKANANGGGTFRARANASMEAPANSNADWLLYFDVAVFLFFGLWFVLLALKPDLIAVPDGAPALKDAPEFVVLHAKAFVGLTLGALAAVGTAS